jgi:hypothetical protein
VETLDHCVELGAEAGRQHDHLEQVRTVTQRGQRLRQVVLENRDALEHVKGCSLVLQAYDHD